MKSLLGSTLVAALVAATPAYPAGILYKAVDSNGTVIFSDTPPPGANVTLVEQRALPGAAAPSRPNLLATALATAAMPPVDGDEELARANEQVDLAEHALALSRRNLWSAGDGMKMENARAKPADLERVEQHKKSLRAARAYLTELVRERQSKAVAVAAAPAAGMPIIVAVSYLPRR